MRQVWPMSGHRGRIEGALRENFDSVSGPPGPPRLLEAMRYAVFPGGSRFRPLLLAQIAHAHGDRDPALTAAACVAIELVHCASLAHDDLPCFDDAAIRRGRASVHAAFDQPTAVLVGDALIIMAFQTITSCRSQHPAAVLRAATTLAEGIGFPRGLVAGQAWEAEANVSLAEYHQAKTASLFKAACRMGAIAAGADPGPYDRVGELLGAAYQIADDLVDGCGSLAISGKPVGVDRAKSRPSAYSQYGAEGCRSRMRALFNGAAEALPPSAGRDAAHRWVAALGARLLATQEAVEPGEQAASGAVRDSDERQAETSEGFVRGKKAGSNGALHQGAGER